MISDQIRQAVQLRAQAADNERQIGSIIFSALSDSGIDWQQVDRDGMKQLVVDAVRAFRSAQSASTVRGRAPRAVALCCA
jgi:hypothetical protein